MTSHVIQKPVVSEKAVRLQSLGTYVFVVHPDTNKSEVKKEVEKRYKVKVSKVTMNTIKGKMKHFRGRLSQRSPIKKAFVTLKKGHVIEVQ